MLKKILILDFTQKNSDINRRLESEKVIRYYNDPTRCSKQSSKLHGNINFALFLCKIIIMWNFYYNIFDINCKMFPFLPQIVPSWPTPGPSSISKPNSWTHSVTTPRPLLKAACTTATGSRTCSAGCRTSTRSVTTPSSGSATSTPRSLPWSSASTFPRRSCTVSAPRPSPGEFRRHITHEYARSPPPPRCLVFLYFYTKSPSSMASPQNPILSCTPKTNK